MMRWCHRAYSMLTILNLYNSIHFNMASVKYSVNERKWCFKFCIYFCNSHTYLIKIANLFILPFPHVFYCSVGVSRVLLDPAKPPSFCHSASFTNIANKLCISANSSWTADQAANIFVKYFLCLNLQILWAADCWWLNQVMKLSAELCFVPLKLQTYSR